MATIANAPRLIVQESDLQFQAMLEADDFLGSTMGLSVPTAIGGNPATKARFVPCRIADKDNDPIQEEAKKA